MIKVLRDIQIWLICHLWARVPIKARVLTLNTNGSCTMRSWWIKESVTHFHTTKESFNTPRDALLFVSKWFIFVVPMLTYRENETMPIETVWLDTSRLGGIDIEVKEEINDKP